MKRRALFACHDRVKHGAVTWTWCGRSFIEDDSPLTPEEERRLAKQKEREAGREVKHCPRCIRAKKKLFPTYVPPTFKAEGGGA
jgi:hypothetical protein